MLSIDRFEGKFAICIDEQQKVLQVPVASIPAAAKEGDLISQTSDGYRIESDVSLQHRQTNTSRLSKIASGSRRKGIITALKSAASPLSASFLAERFHVSRQVIVGDIALIRASGEPVLATPQGYLMQHQHQGFIQTIACRHCGDQMLEELYTIVDFGGVLLDVIVEHPLYGQISGQLQISSRYDADQFYQRLHQADAIPLSTLTGGIHLHTVCCPDRLIFDKILESLRRSGILLDN